MWALPKRQVTGMEAETNTKYLIRLNDELGFFAQQGWVIKEVLSGHILWEMEIEGK